MKVIQMFKKKIVPQKLSPDQDPTSLANLVVREELCTRQEMNTHLADFQSSSIEGLIGSYLVSKDVLTEEQLELLLVKQEAERFGCVDQSHVRRALDIAAKSHKKADDSLSRLNLVMESALARVKG